MTRRPETLAAALEELAQVTAERDALQERVAELSDEIADLRTRECARSVTL